MTSAKIEAASSFILQAPPGEVNDVFADSRAIVADDESFEKGISPALAQYNTEQFITAPLDGRQVLICEAAKLPDQADRFVDPQNGVSFHFDHLSAEASDAQPLTNIHQTQEPLRKAINDAVSRYASNHLNQGASAVYVLPPLSQQKSASVNDDAVSDEKEQADESNNEKNSDETETEHKEQEDAKQETDDAEPKQQATEESEENTEEDKVEEKEDDKETKDEEEKKDEGDTTKAEQVEETQDITTPEQEQEQKVDQQDMIDDSQKTFAICMVGNKYNTSNFWTGRWRSSYIFTPASSERAASLTGTVLINVHYYEQGNVQLSTNKPVEFDLSSTIKSDEQDVEAIAKNIVQSISQAEADYQISLNDVYADFSDNTFRELRRALPLTKQRLNWSRIAGYKLGNEIKGSQ